ncbi:MAG: hypothetical protein DDT19_00383 [Syntrophomonadaceae bacterium]|nr:hypothetical protein [Bacillota bacterium]
MRNPKYENVPSLLTIALTLTLSQRERGVVGYRERGVVG